MRLYLFIIYFVHSFIVTAHDNIPVTTPNAIVYIPWRAQDVSTTPPPTAKKCVFCSIPYGDTQNPLLYQGTYQYVILNNKPYINQGYHFLVIPNQHLKHLHHLAPQALQEMNDITHKVCALFSHESYEIQINYNIGTYANASIPDHLHQHIICTQSPRCYNLVEAIETSTNPVSYVTQYEQLKPLFNSPFTPTNNHHTINNANCYYCSIIQSNADQKNLIIHRGEQATILFNHYPFCPGEIMVIPNKHYEGREKMPDIVVQEMWSLVTKIYPIMLSSLNVSDMTVGMISYGEKSPNKQHIHYTLTPRTGKNFISPCMRIHPIESNITTLYECFIQKWNMLTKPL
jgi:diadenosine tetraphosphate (Ap4A) HIT family hydrolase